MVWCKFVEIRQAHVALSIREIEIFNDQGQNVAEHSRDRGACTQSSIAHNPYGGPQFLPDYVINGWTNDDPNNRTCTNQEADNWIRVGLQAPTNVTKIVVHAGFDPDGRYPVQRLQGAQLILKDDFQNPLPRCPPIMLQGMVVQEIVPMEQQMQRAEPIWAKHLVIRNQNRPISIKEVEVFHPDGHNIIKDCEAEQSSVNGGQFNPKYACNGWTNDDPNNGTLTHGGPNEQWKVFFNGPSPVERVVIWNRFDPSGQSYGWLQGAQAVLQDDNGYDCSQPVILSGEYKQEIRFMPNMLNRGQGQQQQYQPPQQQYQPPPQQQYQQAYQPPQQQQYQQAYQPPPQQQYQPPPQQQYQPPAPTYGMQPAQPQYQQQYQPPQQGYQPPPQQGYQPPPQQGYQPQQQMMGPQLIQPVSISCDKPGGDNEGITNLLMDDREKWCAVTWHEHCHIEFILPGEFVLKQFIIRTANDCPERDPHDMRIELYADDDWRMIQKWNYIPQFGERHMEREFPLMTTDYNFSNRYRIVIENNQGSDDHYQLEMIKLIGEPKKPDLQPLPSGSWKGSARNIRIENGYLFAQMKGREDRWVDASILIEEGAEYSNHWGSFRREN